MRAFLDAGMMPCAAEGGALEEKGGVEVAMVERPKRAFWHRRAWISTLGATSTRLRRVVEKFKDTGR